MVATPQDLSSASNAIRFVLDGEVVVLQDIDPMMTVLTYLRDELRRTGTKEGCAEGDCGACTVVVGTLHNGRVRFRAINACIQFVPMLDGKALFTVESLRGPDRRLHPVQRAMIACHASQCGFCTPGIVMSLFALYKSESSPSRQRIQDALAGNLCRCTGYRPILDAAEAMYRDDSDPAAAAPFWLHQAYANTPETSTEEAGLIEQLRALQRRTMLALQGERRYFAPTTLAELTPLTQRYPHACLLAGGTDVGVWVTKQYRDLDVIIDVSRVEALTRLVRTDGYIDVGAAVTLTDAYATLALYYPALEELWRRFAALPIRNVGTLGGNVANGSPVGDSMPALMVLGTILVLRCGTQRRDLRLDDFYLAYRRTALAPGEFIECLRIPIHPPSCHFRTYKVAKRYDQDIAAVCAAYCLTLKDGRVQDLRIAYGGMAATPKRAWQCEQALIGQPWTEASVLAALPVLDRDYTPQSDMRASAAYRRLVAKNLLRRFFLESSGQVRLAWPADAPDPITGSPAARG